MLGIYLLWPEERRNRYDTRTGLSKIDFVGNMLLVIASILLIFAIQEGASFVWKWSSPVIIWSLVVSGVCWLLLVVWESYLFYGQNQVIQPIFPLRLAVGRVYLSSFLQVLHFRRAKPLLTQSSVTLMTGFVYIALVIKIPERLQITYRDNALGAGVHLLPMLGACAFGSFLGGLISKKKNLTSETLIVGCVLQTLGIGLVYGFTQEHTPLRLILGCTAIYGFGVGLCFAASTMIAAIESRQGDLAAAQGAVAQARVFGGALGLAICTVVFNERLQRALGPGSGSGMSERELELIHRSPMSVLSLPADVQREVGGVYLTAFREQMLIMTAVAAASVVVSLASWRVKATPVTDAMAYHKEFAARSNDTELESTSSVRSLVR